MRLLEEKLGRFGSRPGLERMEKLMHELKNPQDELKVMLVGGTNGKGSTVSYISSILAKAGYKAGSFYSPHMVDYHERFRINDGMISESLLARYEQEIIELFDKGTEMTEFEALTAIAYQYFADQDVDYAVMEVGMGGEYDATNITKKQAAVITNVELDHTRHLGNSIEEIARTKAGILKDAKAGISAAKDAALAEIEKVSPVRALSRDFFVEPIEVSAERTAFSYIGKTHYGELETSLLGRHQVDNAACAVAAIESLNLDIAEKPIRKGLKQAENMGRLEMISENPRILIDAAHNPAGMGSLITTIQLFDFNRLIVVFGSMERKDWKGMLRLLEQHADLIIANKPQGDAADPNEIVREASAFTEAIAIPDVKDSLEKARSAARDNDLIVVCGSIYMLGELLG